MRGRWLFSNPVTYETDLVKTFIREIGFSKKVLYVATVNHKKLEGKFRRLVIFAVHILYLHKYLQH